MINKGKSILDKISYLCFQRKFGQADVLIESFFSENKKNPEYWNHIGNCYYHKRDYIKAELFFTKSLDINKQYAPAWNNLGLISLQKKLNQTAVEQFEKALLYDSSLILPRYNLAQIFNNWGLGRKSLNVLKPIENQEKGNPYFESNLAYAYYLNKDYQKAVGIYDNVDEKYLKKEGWRVFYPLALIKAGRIKEAKSWIDSLTISSRNKDFFNYNRLKEKLKNGTKS